MGATNLFGKAHANMLGGEAGVDAFQTDFLTDTIKVALTTSSYAFNLDTHETFADVTNEVTGTGYTAGGATLGSKTITYTAANSWGTTWAASTVYTAGQVVRPTTGNAHLYVCVVGGTSAASEPTWPTTSRQTVTDNTVTWAEIGRGITQIDAADPSWTSATIASIKYGVGYRSTGTASTSPLLWIQDLDGPHTVTNGTFTIQFSTLGIYHFHTP